MTIWQIITRLIPFVKPYKLLILILFVLTMVGAVAAQVNALVLRYTVDTIQNLLNAGKHAQESISLLIYISAILFGKEIVNIAIRYGQGMIGDNLRVNLQAVFRSLPSKNFSPINTSFLPTAKMRPANCKRALIAARKV